MDIFFHDPDDVPLPPDEVHIRKFVAEPYPDGRRVRVYLEISPFQKRPSAEIAIKDEQGLVVASASIIETVDPRLEMTLHLRGSQPSGSLTIQADLFYDQLPEDTEGNGGEYAAPARTHVDHAEDSFLITE